MEPPSAFDSSSSSVMSYYNWNEPMVLRRCITIESCNLNLGTNEQRSEQQFIVPRNHSTCRAFIKNYLSRNKKDIGNAFFSLKCLMGNLSNLKC